MVRTTLIIIVFLLMGLGVHARSYLKTYEDFVHLPQHEQDKIIIKTMELVVELETNYIKETEIYGHSSFREEQFKKAVQKIVSLFFLNSVYAQAGPVPWAKMGEDFNKLMTGGASNKCLYAGWVSETKIVGNKTICSHPSFTKSKVNGYQKPLRGSKCLTKAGKEDATKIQCSPLIFGYQNIQKQSLFCVSSKNGSHNSSFDCMKAALSTPPEPDADQKEKRIKFLREKIYANPAIFKNAQEFIYKSCVCPNLPEDTKLSKDYHKYMQPHRTCYGLMEMMGETFTSCQNTDLQIDLSIFKSLQEHTAKLTSGGNDPETDKHYKNFVDGIAKISPNEVQRLCNGEVTIETTPLDVQPIPVVVVKLPTAPMTNKPFRPVTPNQKLPEIVRLDPVVQEVPSLEVNIKEETDTTVTVEAVAKDPGKSTIEFIFVDRPADIKDVDPPAANETTVSSDLTKVTIQTRTEISYQVCGVLKDDKGKELHKSCVEIKPISQGPTLQVKIIKTEATAVIIEAKVENEGDNIFSWSIKNPPAGLTIAKGWETKTDSKKTAPPKLKGVAEDAKADEGEDKKGEKKPEEKAAVISDNKIITQTRLLARYQVCGALKTKLGKEIKTGCANVEPVAVKKDPRSNQSPMNQGPPMPPLRAPSDTSAFGIR